MPRNHATRLLFGVTLAVGLLLAASIRSSCSSGGAGTISVTGNKSKAMAGKFEPGRPVEPPKKSKNQQRPRR